MRQKRAKAYRKLMATFERHFGFRSPYQVLFTADFLSAAESFKLSAVGGVHRTLQGDVKGMMSQCCIKLLYDADAQSTITTAKTLERRRCGHIAEALSPAACVLECVGSRNKNRYVVATQDRELRAKLREIPGVPLVYINRSVMVMEPPSPATVVLKEERERAQRGITPGEAVALGKRKRQSNVVAPQSTLSSEDAAAGLAGKPSNGGADAGTAEVTATTSGEDGGERLKKRKKRGPPGPNPLSMKKKKPTTTTTTTQTQTQRTLQAAAGRPVAKSSTPPTGATGSDSLATKQNKAGAKAPGAQSSTAAASAAGNAASTSTPTAVDGAGDAKTRRKRPRKHKRSGQGAAPGGDNDGEQD